jgi:hypothetical protein
MACGPRPLAPCGSAIDPRPVFAFGLSAGTALESIRASFFGVS